MTDWRLKGKDIIIPAMELLRRFAPFAVSVLFTPVALGLGIMSAGAGHSNYFLAKILFPYTMLSTVSYDAITISFIFIAVVQYPIYGLILSSFRQLKTALIVLAIAHAFFAVLAVLYVGPNFS